MKQHMTNQLIKRVLVASCLMMGAYSLGACVDSQPPADYADPTQLDQVTTRSGISVQLLEPADIQRVEEQSIDMKVRAWLEGAESSEVRVTANHFGGRSIPAQIEGSPGPEQTFTFPLELNHGRNEIVIAVQEVGGTSRRTAEFPITYVGDAPGIVVLRTGEAVDGNVCGEDQISDFVGTERACVSGRVTAADGASIQSFTVSGAEGSKDVSLDENGMFSTDVALDPDADNMIELSANDSTGSTTTTEVSITQDSTPPSLTVDSPDSAETITTAEEFTVEGTLANPEEISSLTFVANPGGSTSIETAADWSVTVPLGVGENPFEIVATDLAGNESSVSRTVRRQRVHMLNAPPEDKRSTILRLSRDALEELLDEDAQKELLLAEIAIEPFLFEAVEAIRNPVASGIDTSDWGPAQQNFFELLNLSVDTADLDGTSLEELSDLSYAIGLPTARVLARVLDVEVTEPALTTDLIVEALIDDLVLTHPNAVTNEAGEPVLQITLFDALNNLEPLADRFGPAPSIGHPGIIGGAISSNVFEPGFLMSARATSNLIEYQGVDASGQTKDYIFRLDGDQVLELDVFDDETFSVVGLVDEPVVDITIAVREDDEYIEVGDAREVDPIEGRPGFFRGNSEVWDLDPWKLEYIVADTVLRRFIDNYESQDYMADYTFSAGSIENAAEISWDKGWLVVETAGDLGDPPDPQYAWDALLELAEARLHDGGLAEGEADAVFDLEGVPVGIDSEGLIAALRPALDDQQERLSELLLGGSAIAESSTDFFFVPSSGDAGGFLFFRHPSDDDSDYGYANPGFYSDVSLSTKVSTTGALAGTTDDVHEKVAVEPGDTYFFEDDEGGTYEVLVEETQTDQLNVLVTPAGE